MQSELFLDVRYYETDQMGIVHHSNYVRYFECGRTDMLKKLGLPIEQIEQTGVMLPVVAVECRYKVPARLGDTLKIVSIIDSLPLAKLTIRNEIFNQDNQLVAEGKVVLGFIDADSRRPVRCPKMLTEFFEKHI
mgnify:FL=1